MSSASKCSEKQVKAFCAQIDAEPLLVQGGVADAAPAGIALSTVAGAVAAAVSAMLA
jgi:hypothetical protein